MVAAVGFEVVTKPALREALLAAPEIARRLAGVPIQVHDPHTHFLQAADGPAVLLERGRDCILVAPSLERVSPHEHRIIDYAFYATPAEFLWVDSENAGVGAALGAEYRGNFTKLTLDNGKVGPRSFWTWRLPVTARLEGHEAIRVEGGRVAVRCRRRERRWTT